MLCLGFPRGFHQRVKRKNHIKILILGFSRKKSGSWVHVPTRQPLAGARTAHFQSSVRPWFSRFYHPSPLGPHVETRALIPCLEAPVRNPRFLCIILTVTEDSKSNSHTNFFRSAKQTGPALKKKKKENRLDGGLGLSSKRTL